MSSYADVILDGLLENINKIVLPFHMTIIIIIIFIFIALFF
jgi:hypothetical protein